MTNYSLTHSVIIVASNNELNGALAASKMDLMVDALGLGTFYSGFLQIATNDNNEILDFYILVIIKDCCYGSWIS